MTAGNGLSQHVPAVMLGRGPTTPVQLVEGGSVYQLREPSGLQLVELMKLAELPLIEQVPATLDLLCRLMPDAPEAEIRDLPLAGIMKGVELASKNIRQMEQRVVEELADPNGTRGTTTGASAPVMSSATSVPS